jgi:ATP-dependent DNA helicase RecQ
MESIELHATLKRYFGHETFRPLQEQIVRDALAGRDVFALLPTGGGKSLCFQLPALLRPGLTVVVSPLISLMKDQVDALQTSGIPATFLNSALESNEARSRLRRLHNGEFRLLYVAPERLMLEHFLENLKRWQVCLIAIDEAHCISEWGHDFRPEYRQLADLRAHFSDVPMMALTATATERVREDVVKHLKLRAPGCYVASFNRPNLMYRVLSKSEPYTQLLEFVRRRERESGIVYCASRKTADRLAGNLSADGVAAKPYHAGLTAEERTRNQDLFLRDEVRVITATIAFGMGINKPNVRYVVHHDLPKNIEGYYQETGRAGRDGLPSDCLLFFSAGDVAKQMRFIEEKSDREQLVAREQLRQMVQYAESRECRRATLLRYFGEERNVASCDACDNCLTPRETFDGTVTAQKFLSCIYRVRQKSGFAFGLNHIVDVLTGGETEAIRQRHHDKLSTYGVGSELNRKTWQSIGRELLRLGLIELAAGKFATLQLTVAGLDALKRRSVITLTKPMELPEKKKKARRTGQIECDEALFERLRNLRRKLADERDVPAYIIFSDVSLREMARIYPTSSAQFGEISGVGQQKLKDFAKPFIGEVIDHLASNPRLHFSNDRA